MKNVRFGFVVFFIVCSIKGQCDIRLPKLISDGAIFQRDTELTIWGWADANEEVELKFDNNTFKSSANMDGEWFMILPPQKNGGPYEMTFRGKNQIVLKNILFGDVWICSGQSNMELTMDRLKDTYPDIIKTSKNSKIRQFLVPDKYDFNKVHTDLDGGSWKEANPENLSDFSGVAYFFASELYEKYHVPIGLINAALGGSPVEAWMSEDALVKFPESWEEMQRFKNQFFVDSIIRSDRDRREAWYTLLDQRDKGLVSGAEWFSESIDVSEWNEMGVPNFWKDGGIPDMDGVVWFRKEIIVPKGMAGREAKLWLGRIVDQDFVYVNGTFVGTTGYQYPPRKYTVPKDILKEGKNIITIRVINNQGDGGFILDKPYFISGGKESIDLKGSWKYNIGAEMSTLESETFVRWKPGGLYNHMIAPLTNYKIRGAIWYQGESNAGQPGSYFTTFPALIENWRDKWQMGNFPFLYVQLANFMEETFGPVESNWAELRQAQLETLALPNTGMAVIIDIGEWNDIHPLNKEDVGSRLAQLAAELSYGEKNADLCPVPSGAEFNKVQVLIKFKNAPKGLISKNGKDIESFEVSSDYKTYYPAKAKIKGSKVVIWNEKVANPLAVRYAWSNNPKQANLVSKSGLPSSPFQIKKQ